MITEFNLEDTESITPCHHYESESRIKLDSMGNPRIVLQCITCGKRMSKDISTENFTPAQLDAMPRWDAQLQKKFYALAGIAWYEQKKANDGASLPKDSEDYLLSDKWKGICDKVMARAKMTCEGCGSKPAVQVHHLTYRRFGDEMLFDLVAVCEECRGKINSHTGNAGPELH
ncbi:MAG: hypothetical protein WCP60_02710 [bacterium]